jgi:hypothetical protein
MTRSSNGNELSFALKMAFAAIAITTFFYAKYFTQNFFFIPNPGLNKEHKQKYTSGHMNKAVTAKL